MNGAPKMEMPMQVGDILRAPALDTPEVAIAECARCGRFNRLVPRRTNSGRLLMLQPTHYCLDGISELGRGEGAI